MFENVLVIDSDDLERRRLRRALLKRGLTIFEADNAIAGLFETVEHDPDLILLAEEVRSLVAGDLLAVLRLMTSAPIIVIGGGGEPEEVAMLESGADFYLRRPFSPRVLVSRMGSLVRRFKGYSRALRSTTRLELAVA